MKMAQYGSTAKNVMAALAVGGAAAAALAAGIIVLAKFGF